MHRKDKPQVRHRSLSRRDVLLGVIGSAGSVALFQGCGDLEESNLDPSQLATNRQMLVSTTVTFTSVSPSLLILLPSDADGNTPSVDVQEVYINGVPKIASSWFAVTDVEPYGGDQRGTLTCLRPAAKFAELCAQHQSGHMLINAGQSYVINVFFAP